MDEGPPCMNRKITRLARAGNIGDLGASGSPVIGHAPLSQKRLQSHIAEPAAGGAQHGAAGKLRMSSEPSLKAIGCPFLSPSQYTKMNSFEAISAWVKLFHAFSSSICSTCGGGSARRSAPCRSRSAPGAGPARAGRLLPSASCPAFPASRRLSANVFASRYHHRAVHHEQRLRRHRGRICACRPGCVASPKSNSV